MNEDVFNMSLRKFLKKVGVTSQREIEKAVRDAIDKGQLRGDETLSAEVTLKVGGVELSEKIDGKIELAEAQHREERTVMAKPVVYGPGYSTFVRTARLALEEKGAEYDLVEVDLLTGAGQSRRAPGPASVRQGPGVRARRLRVLRDRRDRALRRRDLPRHRTWCPRMRARARG